MPMGKTALLLFYLTGNFFKSDIDVIKIDITFVYVSHYRYMWFDFLDWLLLGTKKNRSASAYPISISCCLYALLLLCVMLYAFVTYQGVAMEVSVCYNWFSPWSSNSNCQDC